ncbi:MAG: DEAD/DEAH box helicase [Clostridia bacterium]|nr:DEAD/DEAH box helicase [Clostridia bacterium]
MAATENKQNLVTWDWRSNFSDTFMLQAMQSLEKGSIINFRQSPDGSNVNATTDTGFHVYIGNVPTTYEQFLRFPSWYTVRQDRDKYPDFRDYFSCDCSVGRKGGRCRHMALVMLYWEKLHGPFTYVVDPKVREKYEAEQRSKKREAMRRYGNISFAHSYFETFYDPMPASIYFQMDTLLQNANLSCSMSIADAAEKAVGSFSESFQYTFDTTDSHEQIISTVWNQNDGRVAKIAFTQKEIRQLECGCGQCRLKASTGWYYFRPEPPRICHHALALWIWTRQYVLENNPGDKTDPKAHKLMSLLSRAVQKELIESTVPDEEPTSSAPALHPTVDLRPRLLRNEELKIVFDLSENGEKGLLVKDFDDLVSSVEEEKVYTLGKKCAPDFSKVTFTEKAARWYDLIRERVRFIDALNDEQNQSRYYYYSNDLSPGNSFRLKGRDADRIYDLAEGTVITDQFGTRTQIRSLVVSPEAPKASISLSPLKASDKLIGIEMKGEIPRFIEGESASYLLNDRTFSRISADDFRGLRPFLDIAGDSGSFSCVIGERQFQEFSYRILPSLRDSGLVQLKDEVSQLLEPILPPEPEFTFFVDVVQDRITCRVTVAYGEDAPFPLGFPNNSTVHDFSQEDRVLADVRKFFPDQDHDLQEYTCVSDDNRLITIKTEALPMLSRFGTVNGSDAFRRIQFRKIPHTSLSVSLESDLLDLSIKTTDLTSDELLEILSSYRQKKRWHRLRSGDFIDLRNAQELEDLDQTLSGMNLTLEELLKGDVHVPKYRALYVEKMLEAHDELASSRDSEFKSLIRSFQTIRDSSFEPPKSLENTLRSYQLYGFRWLSTVSAYGFGGILADEMGLGKTLQMLSWLLSQKDAGETRPALIVCPASLVYNWAEECRRFTPGLTAQTLDGNLAHRKELLEDIEKGNDCFDLYITSYDLLRRDIALYDKLSFSAAILDEAQYIKNQNAAVSKSVRILKATHRFALTGTPIENRLSELWSIFDFLMPGFLYTSSEFAAEFETPIMKYKDPDVTTRLSRMTEPFILRRKKTDVLKDLPEKLEETRSSVMESDQRKLYDAQVVHMKLMLDNSSESNEDKMRILAEITRLRQICCDPSLIFENYHGSSTKRTACMDLIESAIDGGHRMLLFSQFTSMLSLLADDLKERNIPFYTITGATPKQERLRLVNSFNSGNVPVFLISLKAGGTGLNLTGADVVIHYDPWWNIAVQNQATDRAHRIGQTRQVTVIRMIAADTIEERIVQLQEAKRDLAEAIINGQSNSLMSLSKEELMDLIG